MLIKTMRHIIFRDHERLKFVNVIAAGSTFGLAVFVESVTHKFLSSTCTSLVNSLQSEMLCITCFFNQLKVTKKTIILDLPKFSKLTIISDIF